MHRILSAADAENRLADVLRKAESGETEFVCRYLTDRRLEATACLLVDAELKVRVHPRPDWLQRPGGLSRAFQKRYGVRPTTCLEFRRPPPAPKETS